MKRKFTLTCLGLILGLGQLFAAYTQPEAGKVYRIHNVKYGKVIGEDAIARQVASVDAADNSDFTQLWVLSTKGSGYLLQNAYSGQYLSHCSYQSTEVYPTSATEATMYLTAISGTKYAIGQGSGQYLHLDAGNNIVRWWDKDTEPSQWQFEEVKVSSEAITLQQAAFKTFYEEYQARIELINHLDEYNALLPTFFADAACTELLPAYAEMDDQALRTAMSALPATLQDMALKIKNDTWGHREKEFRIRNYKAYSDADYWAEKLYTKKYSRINNPTGIYGNAGEVLYIFVGNDIPEGTKLEAEVITGSSIQGTAYTLHKGLNMVPTLKNYTNLFIQYIGQTSLESETLITNYPELSIHVEEGTVNGFWHIDEHDDADWVDMMTNLATSDMFQVKGERIMFHMSKRYMKEFCPKTITDAIGWWDDMVRWQQDMMGIEDVRLSKFNNLCCAISLNSGYQSATHYRTQYLDSYIVNLLPYENMMSNADNCWGPAHENGHVHQAAIQSVGTSEVSNNFFSNLTLFKLGKYVSRGSANDVIFTDYAAHKPYILRDGASTLRSFWQLYLYFHEAKVDTTFYPRVFQAMRATPLKARDPQYYANYVYGNEDLLLFAKACCDVAQLDLSEFFRFWGYLEITDKQHIGDYGDFYLTTRQSDVDEFLAHAAQYPKAPSIIFIEDRVKAEPRTDGGKGNKLTHGASTAAGQAGDVGHYTDFMDTSVKAEGYIYDKNGTTIEISGGTGAVGFKVYTKENQLISGSNRMKFNIPSEYKMAEIVVVAAQADGTDAIIKSRAEGGSESEQLALLKEALSTAKAYVQRTDATGTKIGYFLPDSVEGLNALIKKVEDIILNSDQSEKSYGAWSVELTSAISILHANLAARIPLTPDCFYSVKASNDANRYLATANATATNLSAVKPQGDVLYTQWRIIPAETEGTYYMQNRETGKYISTANSGTRAKAEATSETNAIAFKLVPDIPGEFYIQHASNTDIVLYNDPNLSYQIYAGKQTGTKAKWFISMEDNMLSQPKVKTNEQLTIYYLQRTDNKKYAFHKDYGRSDKGCISSDAYSDPNDFNYWFYFTEGSQEGKYAIYNFATGMPVTSKNGTLYANKEAESAPEYSITLNEEGTGFNIATEEGAWYVGSQGLVELSANNTTSWKLQRARTISLTNEPLTTLTIDNTSATLIEGDSLILTVSTAPVYATDHTVTWTSNKPAIATIDATGKVKAIAAGNATITATANDGSGLKATCSVTVKAKVIDGITDISTSIVEYREGAITINGVTPGTEVSIYDTTGSLIAKATAKGTSTTIITPARKGSTAIVKIGNNSMKVQIK